MFDQLLKIVELFVGITGILSFLGVVIFGLYKWGYRNGMKQKEFEFYDERVKRLESSQSSQFLPIVVS